MFALMNRAARRRNDSPSPSFFAGCTTGRFLAAATAVALTGGAGTALADTGFIQVRQLSSPVINVKSDGSKYTGIPSSSQAIKGDFSISLDADFSGSVKSWTAWPKLRTQHGDWVGFESSGDSASYSFGSRPKEVDTVALFSISRQAYAGYVTSVCNDHANALRNGSGLTNEQIFGEDRSIKLALEGGLSWEMTGLSGGLLGEGPTEVPGGTATWDPKWQVTVTCLKSPPPRVPVSEGPTRNKPEPKRKKPKVKSVGLEVLGEGGFSGPCSLRLIANIESTDPGEILQFRFESNEGHKSDLKSIVTGPDGMAERVYDYDLPANTGMRSGQVRIKFKGLTTTSAWEDYQVHCGAPTDDLLALLPPKPKVLTLAVEKETFHQGKICPEVITVIGRADGRGKASGTITLGANGNQLLQKPFSFQDDETQLFVGKHQISWAGKPATQQNLDLTMFVHNALGKKVDALKKMKSVECRKPEISDAVQGGPSGLAGPETPAPKSVNLSLTELGKKVQDGYVCPKRIYMGGSASAGANGFSGSAAFFAGGSLKHEQDLDLQPNQGYGTSYMHYLDWSGAAFPQQTVVFAFRVVNQHGVEVGSKEVIENLVCQKITTTGVAGAAPGGLSIGKPKPTHAQQAATGHLVFGTIHSFNVQAPKGRVKSGKIQLSGAKAEAKYALRFYRKKGSSYVPVASAQLPKQMTGSTASFKLAALKGSRAWRLEVCPAGAKDKKACKTTDFRVPVTKSAGGVKASKGQANTGPTPITPVFIMPGLGG